jgi:hypothetical protein
MGTLPTPQHLLTSLINTISGIAIQPEDDYPTRDPPPRNPLRDMNLSYRPLLMTLHVLYPSLLLPALDLLDRNLVTRFILFEEKSGEQNERDGRVRESENERAKDTKEKKNEDENDGGSVKTAFYLVRSTGSASKGSYGSSGRPAASTSSTSRNIVRLEAWHCSCARFAYELFPSRPDDNSAEATEPKEGEEVLEDGAAEGVVSEGSSFTGLRFGGNLARNERGGEPRMPCCKHLLACLLAERWRPVLGRYVLENQVGRHEMAGLVFDL